MLIYFIKILFIKSVVSSELFTCDFGIGSLISSLKTKGYDVDLFIYRSSGDLRMLKLRIDSFKPDVFAFSTYASSFKSTLFLSQYLRKKYPVVFQVCGGVHVILNPQDVWKNGKYLDAICTGEGEDSFVKLLNSFKTKQDYYHTPGFWIRHKNQEYRNSPPSIIENINALAFPNRELFSLQRVRDQYFDGLLCLEFLFSRGCPYNCSFCSNHALKKAFTGHQFVRQMSPEKAIEWIKHDITYHPCQCLSFHDDTFTWNNHWLDSFLKLYKKEIKLPFICNVRADTVTQQSLVNLKNSGCIGLQIGVESGSTKVRNSILKKNITNEQYINTFSWAHELGLKTLAFFMIGMPGEKPSDFIETIKLYSIIKPSYYSMSIFYPYPGTELSKVAKKMKLKSYTPKSFIERSQVSLKLPNFSSEDIHYFIANFNSISQQFISGDESISARLHKTIRHKLLTTPPSSNKFVISQHLLRIDSLLSTIKNV